MSSSSFSPGVLVTYKGNTGTIRFVDDSANGYLTICIATEAAMGPVCLVVYKYQWTTSS